MCRSPLLSIGLIGLLLVSCAVARTNITSYVDPDFKEAKYSRIMVIVPVSDIDIRKDAETYFVSELSSNNTVSAFASIELIPPTREFSAEAVLSAINKNKIDAILLVVQTDSSYSASYIPGYTNTAGQATISNNTANYTSSSVQYGNFYVYKPRQSHDVKLIDAKTGKCAWTSSSKTRGNAYAKSDAMLYSLARETVYALTEDGLLP